MASGLIFIIIVVALVLYMGSLYNRLVSLKNRHQNAFAQIDVQLKRRYDLIPNLVETARSYMAHESKTLEAVVAARNDAYNRLQQASANPGDGDAIHGLAQAENRLGGALGKLNVTMEAYPDLKANQTMMQLSEELTSTENKVSFARQAFNDAVTEYNTARQSFPANLFVSLFGHTKDATLLEFDDRAAIQAAPKVSF